MKRLLLAICTALFALPLMGQDSMPAYVLFRLVDRGPVEDPMSYLPGYPVTAMAIDQYTGKQILPKFGQIIITDMTVDEARAYCSEWNRAIDWEFVSHDWTTDTHVLNVFTKAEHVSASGLNGLTRDIVESYLNNWGGVVQAINPNSVQFRANVTDVILSDGFWGRSVPDGVLTETSYSSSTGIHSFSLNYGLIPSIPLADLAAIVTGNGCVITGNKPAQKKATFDCGRDTVFSQFKQDVKVRTDTYFARRKWRITQSAIDAIIAAGGSIELTRDQMLDFWHSRLTD
jgi:hypothetical protein